MLAVISSVTYSRLTARSADLQSAVSQNCILRSAGWLDAPTHARCLADYKSAIRQISNLRYVTVSTSLMTEAHVSLRAGLPSCLPYSEEMSLPWAPGVITVGYAKRKIAPSPTLNYVHSSIPERGSLAGGSAGLAGRAPRLQANR